MDSGVSKLIGQAICRHKLLHDNSSNPTLIGMISWGILTDSTHQYIQHEVESMMMFCHLSFCVFFLKGEHSIMDIARMFKDEWNISLDEDLAKVPDVNHTHWLLLDMNRPNYYLDDEPRSRFVEAVCEKRDCKKPEREKHKCHAVTIIVDGGRHTLDVILNDVKAGRPVVIIHGSGRIASLLGMLLQSTDDKTKVE
jgi:hypothetical protein